MKKFLERSFHRHPIVTISEVVEPTPVVAPQQFHLEVNHVNLDVVEDGSASTDSGPVIATISYFPQASNSVTKLVVPEPCHHVPNKVRKKSIFDEMLEADHGLSSKINKKLRHRRKSSAKNTTLELQEHDDHMGKLLSKSLKAQENLKSIKASLGAIATNQSYVSHKVSELRGRIDSLCELTHRIGKSIRHVERETKEIKRRQKIPSISESYHLLFQLKKSWSVYMVDALGRDESKYLPKIV